LKVGKLSFMQKQQKSQFLQTQSLIIISP